MKLYVIEFDDRDVPVIEEGIAVETLDGKQSVNLGVDVGGQTLAMVPLRIPLDGLEPGSDGRLREAHVAANEDGGLSFQPPTATDAAFVVLSVIQRSPDARTEVDPYGDGVDCIGNAFEKPMDRQLVTMKPGSRLRFRRFGRGGHLGPWFVVEWNGLALAAIVEDAT